MLANNITGDTVILATVEKYYSPHHLLSQTCNIFGFHSA